MQMEKETYKGTAVLKPRGMLVGGRITNELDRTLDEFEQNGVRACVVDFGNIRFMNCRGLGALMKRRKTFKQAGKDLQVANMNDRVKDVIRLTGLSDYFQIDGQKQYGY